MRDEPERVANSRQPGATGSRHVIADTWHPEATGKQQAADTK